VGLGTDVAGGYSPSMLSAVRHAVVASRALQDGTDNYRHNHHLDGAVHAEKAQQQHVQEQEQEQEQEGGGEGEAVGGRIEWKEALWMATMGGARALGIEADVGAFGVGMAFDALVVDVVGGGAVVCVEGVDAKEDWVQKWVNNGDDRHVVEVFVQGVEIKRGRRLREEGERKGEQDDG
jgi:guanine deaminase